jgi:uncharacterized membrane-anchored protein
VVDVGTCGWISNQEDIVRTRKKKFKQGSTIKLNDNEILLLPKGCIYIPEENMRELRKRMKKLPKDQREMLERGLVVHKEPMVIMAVDELRELDPKYKLSLKKIEA